MFPVYDSFFELKSIVCDEDYLLRLSKDMCSRFNTLRHATFSEIGTELMFNLIDYDMRRSGFYEHLIEVTEEDDGSAHSLHKLCDYIYWAR